MPLAFIITGQNLSKYGVVEVSSEWSQKYDKQKMMDGNAKSLWASKNKVMVHIETRNQN